MPLSVSLSLSVSACVQCGGSAEIDACGICNPEVPCEIAGPTSCNDDDADGICDDSDAAASGGGGGSFIWGILLGLVIGLLLGAVVGPMLTSKQAVGGLESDSLYGAKN